MSEPKPTDPQPNEHQSTEQSIPPWRAGLTLKCPRCGKGRLFSGFLNVAKKCDVCDLDFSKYEAGDAPAVFIILIVGAIIVAGTLYVELTYQPAFWVHAVLWLPLIIGLPLLILPPSKAFMIALQHHFSAEEADFSED